jgi:hypothetical protein
MTIPTDYRAELQALYNDVTAERWDAMAHRAAIERAQSALAAPEAVGVTDEELLKTYREAKAVDIQRQGGLTSSDLDGFVKQIDASELVGLRAVLARYGAHPAPVPVGERLPVEVADCTTDSECWWWDPIAGCWFLLQGPPLNDYTHWLPHWALPLPEAQP